MDIDIAYRCVTFQNDRQLIRLAKDRILSEYQTHLGQGRQWQGRSRGRRGK